MYVEPEHRGVGAGKAILIRLIDAATIAGYARIGLDSPGVMTTAHGLYRDLGFVETGTYVESEIPDELKPNWVLMARTLAGPET